VCRRITATKPLETLTEPLRQAIITSYPSGEYNIGWHSDKKTSIAPNSIIFDVSLGSERTFLLRDKATGAEESIRMASGSAIALTTAGNELYEHAVLPEPGAGPRVSVVFRNIATTMSRDTMMEKIAVSMKAKAKAMAAKAKAKRAADKDVGISKRSRQCAHALNGADVRVAKLARLDGRVPGLAWEETVPASVLLYVGAWTDAYPLTVPELRAEHTHFIFIDKEPLHPDNKVVSRTEAEIIDELTRSSGGVVGPATHLGDGWEAPLRGGKSLLVYYLNTLDTDIVRNAPAWLASVRTLYVAGFNPCPELVRALPNLKCAISTYMCKYEATGGTSPWFCALPEGTKWVPMTQPDLEDGVWYHYLWVPEDRDKYPLTEMPSVWCESSDDEEEYDDEEEE
jgi:2OG-Fe(II) oxygenase superfamily